MRNKYTAEQVEKMIDHFHEQINQIYDVLIELTQRVERLERIFIPKYVCSIENQDRATKD